MPSNYKKSYTRINWKDFPNKTTPLNEANLNLMDGSLNVIDNRVIELDTTKLDLSVGQTMVKSVTFNKTTGTFTITYLNGKVVNYNTDLEKIATNFEYDHETEELILMYSGGHELTRIDLSDLITQYEFDSSNTITFNVSAGGRISAEVLDGSITANKLQPNYLADIQRNKNEAVAASTLSQSYAVGGTDTRPGEDTDNAKYYKEQAEVAARDASYVSVTRTNLLNPTAQTQTANGVTLTNNGDGTYTVNGTASGGDAHFGLRNFTNISSFENTKLVGCPIGGSSLSYYMVFNCYNGSTWLKGFLDTGNGILISNIPSETTEIRFVITVKNGQTANNLLFKPMITTDLNATYDDFIPYSGGGALNENVQELYKEIQTLKNAITELGGTV